MVSCSFVKLVIVRLFVCLFVCVEVLRPSQANKIAIREGIKIIFFPVSLGKHMLWLLIRSASPRRF